MDSTQTTSMEQWIAQVEQWPRKDLLRALRFHRVSAHRAKTNRALACILWSLRVQQENPQFGK